jgi:hypothetical protein
MPTLAPVTNAVLPLSCKSMMCLPIECCFDG